MEGSSGKSLSYIVGGSSGMGLATARLLVADGGTVVLVAREQDKLAARKGELEAGGKGKVETIAADFYDAEAVKSLIAKIDGETRHINHLVNAAGYFIPRISLSTPSAITTAIWISIAPSFLSRRPWPGT